MRRYGTTRTRQIEAMNEVVLFRCRQLLRSKRDAHAQCNKPQWLGTDEPGPWRGGAAHGVLMTRRAVLLVLFSQHSG